MQNYLVYFVDTRVTDQEEFHLLAKCLLDLMKELPVFTTLPEGPDWERVWHRVTRNHHNYETIETSGIMIGVTDPSILNAPLPHEMDIVTELWYEDPDVNLGREQASGSGSRRRAREEEPQGRKRISEEPPGSESPTSRARTSRATSAKRKAEGEHEAEEAARTRDLGENVGKAIYRGFDP